MRYVIVRKVKQARICQKKTPDNSSTFLAVKGYQHCIPSLLEIKSATGVRSIERLLFVAVRDDYLCYIATVVREGSPFAGRFAVVAEAKEIACLLFL